MTTINYSNLWHKLHEIAATGSHDQVFDELQKTWAQLQPAQCDCAQPARVIFWGLIDNDIENFYKLNMPVGLQKFMVHYHNLINLKLGKPIYHDVV